MSIFSPTYIQFTQNDKEYFDKKKLTIKNVFKELGWGSRDFRKSECNNEF